MLFEDNSSDILCWAREEKDCTICMKKTVMDPQN